jgi:protein-disulfide isomerase
MGKSKRSKRIREREKAKRRSRVLQVVITTAIVVIAGTAWISTRPPDAPSIPPERAALQHTQGPSDAAVTIVEYGDYNCPSCKQYHQLGIIQRILTEYPEDVRFNFRHFPVITNVSPELAEAAECASDQGYFWEFHDLLYAVSPSRPAAMEDYASQLGLDQEEFGSCHSNRTYAALVDTQMQEAFQIGFRGTPSFMINETPLAGPPSYEQLKGMIDSILANN